MAKLHESGSTLVRRLDNSYRSVSFSISKCNKCVGWLLRAWSMAEQNNAMRILFVGNHINDIFRAFSGCFSLSLCTFHCVRERESECASFLRLRILISPVKKTNRALIGLQLILFIILLINLGFIGHTTRLGRQLSLYLICATGLC